MKKRRFIAGIILGSIAGYFASRYLVSESGQRALENIKTIRGDFNNGGFGLADKDRLVSDFNEKTDALKQSLSNKANLLDDDEETTNIVFDENDIKNTEDKDSQAN
jgi:gas vesicle protein